MAGVVSLHHEIYHLYEVDSTSSWLRRRLAERPLPSFSYVTARFQTGGRGQRGNSWESQAGKNLLLSMVFRPESMITPRRQFLISKAVTVAVAEAVEGLLRSAGTHPPVEIKWPNDIYIADRKIAGILIENSIETAVDMEPRIGHTTIGIGLNVNQREFTSPAPNPGSLIQFSGRSISLLTAESVLVECLAHSLRRLDAMIATDATTALDSEYRRRLWRAEGYYLWRALIPSLAPAPTAQRLSAGQACTDYASVADAEISQADNDIFEAAIVSVADDGPLTLRLRSGLLRTFAFKEITPILSPDQGMRP